MSCVAWLYISYSRDLLHVVTLSQQKHFCWYCSFASLLCDGVLKVCYTWQKNNNNAKTGSVFFLKHVMCKCSWFFKEKWNIWQGNKSYQSCSLKTLYCWTKCLFYSLSLFFFLDIIFFLVQKRATYLHFITLLHSSNFGILSWLQSQIQGCWPNSQKGTRAAWLRSTVMFHS